MRPTEVSRGSRVYGLCHPRADRPGPAGQRHLARIPSILDRAIMTFIALAIASAAARPAAAANKIATIQSGDETANTTELANLKQSQLLGRIAPRNAAGPLAGVIKLLLANFPQNTHLWRVRAICEHGKTRNMRAEGAQKTSGGWDEISHIQGYGGAKPLKSGPFQTLQELPAITPAPMRDMT